MRITSLIDNVSGTELSPEHGLSLYVEMEDSARVLFDMGQGDLFARNAIKAGISIADVDMAFVSHGHYDHGGGLGTFLQLNSNAPVYIHEDAFLPHFSMRANGLRYIGLNAGLKDNPRIRFCNGTTCIGESLILFSGISGTDLIPDGNSLLYGPDERTNDNFSHEQSLIIKENGKMTLIAGCAHKGIVNIIHKAIDITGKAPDYVVSGMHLAKSRWSDAENSSYMKRLSGCLLESGPRTMYCTMHCTGLEQYKVMKELMGKRISYLSCGQSVEI